MLATGSWRIFLRSLAEEIDAQGGPGARDELLRGVGRRMAQLLPLPAVASMAALEIEMNDALGTIGWGAVGIVLQETERSLVLTHQGLPRIGAAGDPPGLWLSAVLEGLYEAWLARQPGGDPALIAQRVTMEGDRLILRYGSVQALSAGS